ncbi:MAG: glutaminyl-peptide cyclotransferase [Sphingobacteriaceae bacterium]|nr:glutaminyl-peptide cyclotransferase [Sphingobacteriaceae bacterium]
MESLKKILFLNTLRLIYLCCVAILLFSCDEEKPKPNEQNNRVISLAVPKTPAISYSLISTYPHDSTCFTEGLFFHQGKLFESSGAPDNIPTTRSLFGIVDIQTGKIAVKGELDRNKYFGEGIVALNNKLYQLTWQGQTGFIYNADNFKKLGTFSYMSKEGWGLTTNGKELIMSDGTNTLTFIDPETFQITKTLLVSENNYAVDYLNELEYIKGYLYANIWMTTRIVKIDPETGNVVGQMDLGSFAAEAKKRYKGSLEMNGIAYDSITDKILITGKMWPTLYQINFPH